MVVVQRALTDGLLLLINSNVQSTPAVRHGEAARYPKADNPASGYLAGA